MGNFVFISGNQQGQNLDLDESIKIYYFFHFISLGDDIIKIHHEYTKYNVLEALLRGTSFVGYI